MLLISKSFFQTKALESEYISSLHAGGTQSLV